MEYSIKDLETFTGIKAHTIRIWEKRYKILVPDRTETNIRHYSEEELKYLMNISLLNKNGYKISKLAGHSHEEVSELVAKQYDQSSCTEKKTDKLVRHLIDLDTTGFENSLDEMINELGLQTTVVNVINPFMQKVGWLWQAGSITPVHEHFASNIIRTKILRAITDEKIEKCEKPLRYTLFLPENEQHELSILFAYYLLHKRGHSILYLGQNVPLAELIKEDSATETDVYVTAFTTSTSIDKLVSRVIDFAGVIEPRPLYIKTHLWENGSQKFPKNVKIITSWTDLLI